MLTTRRDQRGRDRLCSQALQGASYPVLGGASLGSAGEVLSGRMVPLLKDVRRSPNPFIEGGSS